MTAAIETEVLSSDIPVSDVPLSEELEIDSAGYARIMRRIGIQDTSAVPVSAFNSSI